MDMIPKRNSMVAQTAQVLRDLIQAGEWNTYLSTELQLKDRMQVGRNTIRAALEILTKEGWISEGHAGCRREILNRGGQNLAEIRSKVVGLLSPGPMEYMRPQTVCIIDGLRNHLAELGCRLEIYTSRAFQVDKPDRILEKTVQKNPSDAWILLLSTRAMQEWFSHKKFPCMIFGTVFEGIQLPYVDLNYAACTRHAVGQLIRKGHTHLALMLPDEVHEGDKRGESAFWEALATDNHPDRHGTVVRLESNDPESVCRSFKRLMSQADAPTALVVWREQYVYAVMTSAPQLGIRIPQDLSIISLDDSPLINWLVPTIARYKIKHEWIIAKQLRILQKMLSAGSVAHDRVMVEPEWNAGGSVAPPGRH
jgi:DNA-binding LacI/PurR family transcriptional regulator